MNVRPKLRLVFAIGGLFFVLAAAGVAVADKDLGDQPKYAALKNRGSAPTKSQIDASVTLASLLAARDDKALSASKGATVTGYVIQAEKESDGDVHVVLADNQGETSTTKWLIVESTPAWQKRNVALSAARLRTLVGQRVRATGWLYFEPDVQGEDPRGTRWELHPLVSIARVEGGK
jgi:hypothetical protein